VRKWIINISVVLALLFAGFALGYNVKKTLVEIEAEKQERCISPQALKGCEIAAASVENGWRLCQHSLEICENSKRDGLKLFFER
jgi:hypothetical protein